MRHLFTKIAALCAALIIIGASASVAYAADELTINGLGKVKEGDVVTFSLNLSEAKEDIMGFELRFFYDSEYLKYVDESLTSDTFDSLVYNPHLDGCIPMNWTDIYKLVSFSEKKPIFTCQFTVQKGGATELSYFVTEMYDKDMETLTSYKFTYDLSVGDEKIIEDGILAINEGEETLYKYQGGFINYRDGMGGDNTPNKDNHESVVGNQGTVTYNVVENEVQEVTRYVDGEESKGGSPMIYLIIAIPVVVALAAIAVVFVLKRPKK